MLNRVGRKILNKDKIMATYVLTLPIGQITRNSNGTFSGQLFNSKQLESEWRPISPEHNGGWKAGDKLIVACGFHTKEIIDPHTSQPYPSNEQPTPSDFYGLSVDALYNPTPQQIRNAENNLKNQHAGIIGPGITNNTIPNNGTDIFYNAVSDSENVNLQPSSRGTIEDIVYMWTMDFNSSFNPPTPRGANMNPLEIELIFGYGDPMLAESLT